MVDDARVAALLAKSIDAHKAACTARQKKQVNAREWLVKARDLRLEADRLDPEHTVAAWTDEQSHTQPSKDTHQALLNFYATQIGV